MQLIEQVKYCASNLTAHQWKAVITRRGPLSIQRGPETLVLVREKGLTDLGELVFSELLTLLRESRAEANDAQISAETLLVYLAQRKEEADQVIEEVRTALYEAITMYPEPYNSAHEAYGVLAEEVAEYFEEVRAPQGRRNVGAMRKEALQVAAVSARIVLDVCGRGRGQV